MWLFVVMLILMLGVTAISLAMLAWLIIILVTVFQALIGGRIR